MTSFLMKILHAGSENKKFTRENILVIENKSPAWLFSI